MLNLHARGGDTRELKKRFSKITDQLAKQKKEVGRPDAEETLTFLPEDEFSEARTKLEELRRLHKQFFDSSSSNEKKIIKKNIDKIEWEFMEATLKEQGEKAALKELEKHRRDNRKPFFLWKLQFLEVFQDRGGFDVMIANPPYVRQEEIKEFKPALKRSYASYSGSADLYVYFYEKSLRMLNPKGVMAFISSNKYFRAAYGEKLRQLLGRNTRVDQVIDFGDAPVFEATNYPCIVILQDQPPNGNQPRVLSWKPDDSIDSFERIFAESSFRIDQSELSSEAWRLESPTVLRLLDRLKRVGARLDEHVKGKFYYGIKTGLNEAFVIDHSVRNELVAKHSSSRKILAPFLRGRDIKRWNIDYADRYLIRIESSENKEHPWSGQGVKQAEKTFQVNYPAIHEWLNRFRNDLKDRDDQGKYFWELRSCAYWEEFETPKVIYPDIYEHQSFAWDTEGYLAANTCYFMPVDERWLVALLNSKLIEWFYSLVSNKVRGGYLRAFSDYMKQIPVPKVTSEQEALLSAFCGFR